MQITIQNDDCWCCGGSENLTSHHTLPKHLKPKKNLLVPLCEPCHARVTAQDITGLYSYLTKLEKSIKSYEKQVKGIKTVIENHNFIKIKGKKR